MKVKFFGFFRTPSPQLRADGKPSKNSKEFSKNKHTKNEKHFSSVNQNNNILKSIIYKCQNFLVRPHIVKNINKPFSHYTPNILQK